MRAISYWYGDDPVPVADPFYGQPVPQTRFGPRSDVPLKISDHYIESVIEGGKSYNMPPDDMAAAEMCRISYGATPAYVLGDCRIHVYAKGARKVLVVEGTKPYILMDVLHDLRITSFDDPTLGKWPGGFAEDIRAAQYRIIRDFYDVEIEWAGHSKGAAEAAGLAAVLVAIGRSPAGLTLFECPPCCGGETVKLLAAA